MARRRRARAGVVLASGVLGLAAFTMPACNGTGFDPGSLVNSVRILASQADHPYALPGQTVTVTVLAYDGRPIKPEMMHVYWLPVVCTNPVNDLYYTCFSQLGAPDGGAPTDGGGLGTPDGGAPSLGGLRPGVDLTPFLIEGDTFTLTLRKDIITSHAPSPGQEPYGLAIAFNIACAGHVELLAPQPGNVDPVQIPVGCFDANENQLGPNDYVVGFTRVYAYETRTNHNPTITNVIFNDQVVNPGAGVAVPHCTSHCPGIPLDTLVPPSSQEVDPGITDANGNPLKEQVWVDYYTTQGSLGDDARLLYDPTAGQITGTATTLTAPAAPAKGAMLWAVVHDNRGGAAWEQIPLTVQ